MTLIRKERRVRFSEGNNDNDIDAPFRVQVRQLPPSHYIETEQERAQLWWTLHEMDQISRAAHMVARGIRQRAAALHSSTRNSHHHHYYNINSNNKPSYSQTLQRLYMECMISNDGPVESTQAQLEQWTTLGHSRRGLEVLSVPIADRQQQVRAVVNAVLCVQDDLNEEGVVNIHCRMERLRQASAEQTKTASTLARAMARADAVAALQEHKGDRAAGEQVVESHHHHHNNNKIGRCMGGRGSSMEPSVAETPPRRSSSTLTDYRRSGLTDYRRKVPLALEASASSSSSCGRPPQRGTRVVRRAAPAPVLLSWA